MKLAEIFIEAKIRGLCNNVGCVVRDKFGIILRGHDVYLLEHYRAKINENFK